ncbi:MAG: hypothetical protein NTU49_09640 [Gammaproteobacteria bacterium]|nr:hypothetical protein [Gammaproteobacteria bacterium]
MGNLKLLFLILISCAVLSGCGTVDFAPGKAFMGPDIGVSG